MPQDVTRWNAFAHPTWCLRQYHDSNDHDPHTSAVEQVGEDFPSDLVIEAYLLQYRKPITRDPNAALAALEFIEPGEEIAQFLLTFDQLRRLSEALNRLVGAGEQFDPRGPQTERWRASRPTRRGRRPVRQG